MKKLNFLLLVFAAWFFISGCVTQKKRDEAPGPLGMLYQNTTARYNGYYNATLLLEESQLALEQQVADNYYQVLPLYKYTEAPNPKAVAGNLDEAIKKVTVVVNLHRPSHWTDDCYLLMAKAQYLKKDYEAAEETLEYLVEEFSPSKMAEKSAKTRKGKKGKKSPAVKSTPGDKPRATPKTKKQKNREIKKKKKAREKERKQRNREIKKKRRQRKKGKSSGSRTRTARSQTPKPEPKKEEPAEKQPAEEAAPPDEDAPIVPAPGIISLGDLRTDVETESNPESYVLKHRPAYQEGVLWLARTYIERENYTNALRLLKQLDQSPATFDDIRRELPVVEAYYHLKQKNYAAAIPALEKAVALQKDRLRKARYTYIIAQLLQKQGRGDVAYQKFEEVLKYKPAYEMEFSARLQMAQNAYLSGKGSPEEAMKSLERMLKDFKNIEYKDQIYYAMAQIEFQQGRRDEGIHLLKQSLANSTSNNAIKAEAYYQLATLYFESEDFVHAKLYYDSTLQVLARDDERYEPSKRLAANLKEIAANLEVIHLQDSLLRISRMSEEEKRELAFQLKKKQDEERLAAAAAAAKRVQQSARTRTIGTPASLAGTTGATRPGGASTPRSNFFAYDDRAVKRGERDFQRKWGSRPLEDNWRRSNQQSLTILGEEAEEAAAATLTDEEVSQLLKDVPQTEKQIRKAHLDIQTALYALGKLYRDKLQLNQKSIEALETLLQRYPDTQYQLDALYLLYIANKELGNTARADYYKNKIINEYPETTYARLLSDPTYVQQLLTNEKRLNNYYDETYALFTKGQYQQAYDRIEQVGAQFGSQHKLQARFELLKAMCLGNLQGKEAYIQGLKAFIGKYPETPEATRAKEILRLLGAAVARGPGQVRDTALTTPFKLEENKLHYVIVVFNGQIDLNEAKNQIADYHREFHKLDRLRLSNIYLGTQKERRPIIVIRRFKNKDEAMKYYEGVQLNRDKFLDPKQFQYELFPITQNNYREILRAKSIEGYPEFFALHYLN